MYTRTHFHWQRISIYKRGYWGGYFSIYFLWVARYGMTFVKITEALITPKPTVFKPG